jgi:hypothetical protein
MSLEINIHKLNTEAAINDVVDMLKVNFEDIVAVSYNPTKTEDPFVFTPKFGFLPTISFDQALKVYMINIKSLNPTGGITVKSSDALNIAADIKRISEITKMVNLLLSAHNSIKILDRLKK